MLCDAARIAEARSSSSKYIRHSHPAWAEEPWKRKTTTSTETRSDRRRHVHPAWVEQPSPWRKDTTTTLTEKPQKQKKKLKFWMAPILRRLCLRFRKIKRLQWVCMIEYVKRRCLRYRDPTTDPRQIRCGCLVCS